MRPELRTEAALSNAPHRGGTARTSPLIHASGSRRPRARGSASGLPPKVWVLLGQRPGENGQLLSLADALGWPYEAKQLVYNRLHVAPNYLLGASLRNLDRVSASLLTPPWPDIVLASGKRSVPAARWIRRRSDGLAHLVHLGRPRAPLADFDLVVTTPQYRLPARANVLELALPLNRPDPARMQEAKSRWSGRLEKLPRPLIAVMIGGNSWPYVLTVEAARRLGMQANALAGETKGTLLVTTSPRTPAAAADALFAVIKGPAETYRWRPGDTGNPYLAYLALSDRFIVTGDSASLLVEAVSTGKPVDVFRLPKRALDPHGIAGALAGRLARLPGCGRNTGRQRYLARAREHLAAAGIVTPIRDLDRLHAGVIARGLARWSGEQGVATWSSAGLITDDVRRAVERVRALLR